ncbi:uncharacterized protein LOC114755790 [Neltuma alba]|uniref:uncharacterized protein LOC114755790 n=1 Tax=Neltuma alba TaxID=207710 RepID=UPI0010A43D04|nr:uncharacterized protein LOC114755790 [Prosopis alba]
MIPLEFEPEIYGQPSLDYITNDVLKEILMHGMANINAYNYISGLDHKFKIISPHAFDGHNLNVKRKDLSRDLADIFISRVAKTRKTLFLAPYWEMLIVVNPIKPRIWYLDSLNRDPTNRPFMGFMAILHRSSLTLPPIKNGQFDEAFPWKKVKWPCQSNKSSNCGYCVMKFMKEIIMHNFDTILVKYFIDTYCTMYSSSHMEEIIEELQLANFGFG